ncbi:MAG: hypothetical protein LBI14_09370 [Treponema sp.]|jgi:hypothetical protein|nr:hypothetical protein [Treponema sp.]
MNEKSNHSSAVVIWALIMIFSFIACKDPIIPEQQLFTVTQGANLAAKLAWVKTNAQSNTNYIIEVSADESLAPQTLSYNRKTNIGITITGTSVEPVISLSSKGSLFRVETGITLTLNNITLRGLSDNDASLVNINTGNLVMNAGSRITGNTKNYRGIQYGGGAVFMFRGTFTMNGGEISGNTANVLDTDWYISCGGGVVMNGKVTFTMTGGEIFGNTAVGVYSSGGGVVMSNNAYDKASCRISGGVIYGSNEENESLRNTADRHAAASLDSYRYVIAEYGTFSGGKWIKTGILTTTDNTIRVVDGVLVP